MRLSSYRLATIVWDSVNHSPVVVQQMLAGEIATIVLREQRAVFTRLPLVAVEACREPRPFRSRYSELVDPIPHERCNVILRVVANIGPCYPTNIFVNPVANMPDIIANTPDFMRGLTSVGVSPTENAAWREADVVTTSERLTLIPHLRISSIIYLANTVTASIEGVHSAVGWDGGRQLARRKHQQEGVN